MNPIRIAVCAALALGMLTSAGMRGQAEPSMLSRMLAVNPSLHSYQAAIHVDIALKTFPYLSPSLDGMYYHKDPNKNKLVFQSGLPAIAKQFDKLYPRIEGPAQWKTVYFVTQTGDDGTNTSFKLVPRIHSRISHIDVKVDDKTATTSTMQWNYNDGGYATLNQTYALVNGNYLPTAQTGHVEVPSYIADVKSSFSNFKLNPSIPDSFFKQT
ncbi:MAG: hypothetical protein M3Y21_08525 [Candidatus Eremiobacteraeota bacterium]|nr:hypothetical protein [Candidatus Eremiobacteraeota bacterium]